MSAFRTALVVRKPNGPRWTLAAPLVYDSDLLGREVAIPDGFVTDFASVPRLPFAFWWFGDSAHMAAVVHDYLYVTKGATRAEADAVFFEAMAATDVPAWRRWPMWAATRLGGWATPSWRNPAPR